MFTTRCLLILLTLVLWGCGGGGGSHSDGGISGDPHDVDRRAFEAAVEVAASETTVFCEEVFCPFADHVTDVVNGAAYQVVCQWACISVIDDNGELRQYYIALIWDRLDPECFVDEITVWAAGEYTQSCDPNA
jgi:hypothetical protein